MSGPILRLQLFLTSYAPLALIFGVRLLPGHDWGLATLWPSAGWIAAGAAGFVVAARVRTLAGAVMPTPVEVKAVDDQGSNAAAYLATYLFPFLLIGQNTWQIWSAYGIYLLVLAIVSIKSNLILINPTLYLFGRRVVIIDHDEITASGSDVTVRSILVCKKLPQVSEVINVTPVADGLFEA